MAGLLHRRKESVVAYKTAMEEAEKNKHGVTISASLDFGVVDIADAGRGVRVDFKIDTTIPVSRVSLIDYKLTASGRGNSPEVDYGRYEDRIEIFFEDSSLNYQRFVIVRPLKAIVGNKQDYELLKARAPFVPRKRVAREPETEILEGVLPPTLKAVPYVVALCRADIPKALAVSLSTGPMHEVVSRVRRVFLPRIWDSSTYGRHFKNLLWVEEYRMERDLEMYDIPDATLTNHGQYYLCARSVIGFAPIADMFNEASPSRVWQRNAQVCLLVSHHLALVPTPTKQCIAGDRILVQRHDGPPGQWYEGGVHIVRKEEVGLRFHSSFRWSRTEVYNVRFKLNRYPLRRQHQALDTAFAQNRLLQPPGWRADFVSETPNLRIACYNKLIAENPHQMKAVNAIVTQLPGSLPFVVFGPPGTGKTVTIIEAIRQLLRSCPSARILACAPSNSAADLIASRLTMLGTDALFRFYASSRSKDTVPDALLPFTALNTERHFSTPPMSRLKRFSVIVTTCVSASFAYGIGVPRGHFTHMFFDEAGQATEPEIMIGIKTLADTSTNVVLSGDPQQLGPIIRSAVARDLGLETSYLERLMKTPLYDDRTGHGRTVVKLVKNFRSHKSILKFPNEKFYQGELEPQGDPKTINAMIGSPQLVSDTFPIVFHAVSGKDDREAASPSFFNIDEATLVKNYVQSLRSDRHFRVTDQDIGIITPYHAQCLKIKAVLRPIADGVKVGSVEEFQGQVRNFVNTGFPSLLRLFTLQERKIIIISTVRSSRAFIEYDLKHTLGFVANPRRFNVAVTRAQAMLIVIGDPSVLSLDPLWRSFLNYVHLNGGWRGKFITWDPLAPVEGGAGYTYARGFREAGVTDMNDFTRRMEEMTLNGTGRKEGQEVEDDEGVDRPWRETE
ncbi:hypothetical protein HWV62_21363 [Athelia sp. TMB]|nr:hypothetical protein HWV62_21363 [Athelia sp. TMB]